jgi:hypothetical protein
VKIFPSRSCRLPFTLKSFLLTFLIGRKEDFSIKVKWMRIFRFIFGVVIFTSSAQADVPCESLLLQTADFEAFEGKGASGEVDLRVGSEPMILVGSCEKGRRATSIFSLGPVTLSVEYFNNGSVRQYVVNLSGKEMGTIKVERGGFDIDGQYSQPRLSLYNAGRVVGEIANAENQESFFFVRDQASQIIARAKRSTDGKWKVSSESVPPILMAMLLFASRLEKNSCEAVAAHWQGLRGLVFGVSASTFIAASCYYARKRHWV